MAFQQGLSGLNAASKGLDVTSNNIANSSTVGFKSASAHFADVYASSLSGGGAAQAGIGVALSAVQQQYTQGNITTTNNPLDISINGGGFFRMDQNGSVSFTRSGQFHLDKNGYVVNDQALKLTGYPADSSGLVVPSTPVPLQISASDLKPVATGSSIGGVVSGVLANLNLDSRVAEPTNAWVDGPATGEWNPSPTTYNYSTALSVYDTLGNAHTLTYYFVKTANAGEWEVYANVDGTTNAHVDHYSRAQTNDGSFVVGNEYTISSVGDTDWDAVTGAVPTVPPKVYKVGDVITAAAVGGAGTGTAQETNIADENFVVGDEYAITSLGDTDWAAVSGGTLPVPPKVGDRFTAAAVGAGTGLAAPVASGPVAVLQFDQDGVLSQITAESSLSIDLDGVMSDLGKPNSARSPFAFDVDFGESTQFGSSFGVNRMEQDGYTSGRLTGLSVGSDGMIQGRYSNGQTRTQGQVVLANFTNPNGLTSIGNNQWVETSVSGAPQVGSPNTSSLGVLQSASVEESNVDLTAELVMMITLQRNYQANAQSIKTQDQIMNTLVNLR